MPTKLEEFIAGLSPADADEIWAWLLSDPESTCEMVALCKRRTARGLVASNGEMMR